MTNWQRMAALIAGIPDLAGASCKGEAHLFETTIGAHGGPTKDELQAARTTALRLCASCPALDPCRAWLDGLRPTRRPQGVVAGRIVNAANP